MNYTQTLQAIDTLKVLSLMKKEATQQGAYVKFTCQCGEQALIKAYGEKKNLWYCPKCKAAGHIISLFMEDQKLEYKEAAKILTDRASNSSEPITKELELNYQLEYHKVLEDIGLDKDFCEYMGIGVPKGKTMLSGCIALTVWNESGMKVAYYGIRIKDGHPAFHKSFNPELYLLNLHLATTDKEVMFVQDPLYAMAYLQAGSLAVSNFGLPYLSPAQLQYLNRFEWVSFSQTCDEILYQAIKSLKQFRFQR